MGEPDSRLALAARAHAETLISSRESIGDGQIDLLRFTLRRLGGTDYAIEPVITTLDPAGRAFLKQIVAKQQAKWTHCGLGVAETGKSVLAVWIGVERAVEMDPLPMAVSPASKLDMRGQRTQAPDGVVQPVHSLLRSQHCVPGEVDRATIVAGED